MDYIRNSKNRKLKTQILHFFSRLNFGTHRLGLPGKCIAFFLFLLFLSVFFPWLTFTPFGANSISYGAFSIYLGGIGYGIVLAIFLISFFLLSHEKKEYLRGYVPFRLSDAQAIVFILAMLLVSCVHSTITSFAYARIASQDVTSALGLEMAIGSIILLLFSSYFFSQSEKSRSITLGYLDKKEITDLDEYRELLENGEEIGHEKKKDKNMSLPI